MTRQTLAKAILGVATVATVGIVMVADVFNDSHLYNPDWSDHSRFHLRMQFFTLLAISAFSLAALFGSLTKARTLSASLALLAFWPGLIVAWLIAGDEAYAGEAFQELGFPINVAIAAVFTVIALVGLRLGFTSSNQPKSA